LKLNNNKNIKGFAKKNPKEYDLTDAEISHLKQDPMV